MGLLSSVKKVFGGGSKKKEKKKQKKPQKKTYIQNTNVGKKATQVNNQRAVSTRKTGGHTVQHRPQATTRGGVARGNKPKAPARVNRSVGQKQSVRPTGGGQNRPVQNGNRRGNALNTGSYGNIRVNQSARNRNQTNGIQPRQRQVSNPAGKNPVQNVQNFGKGLRNAWNDVSGNKPKPEVQGPPKFSKGYKPPVSTDWVEKGFNISLGPNVKIDKSQTNGIQINRRYANNPSTGNPVRDFQNSVNNIWKEAGKAAPKTFQDFSKEWKASGSGQRDYKTVTTRGRTTPSGTTVEVMPKDLKVGDRVVTTQGTVTITGKKSGAGKALKDLDNAYDQAVTRYASAYNSGNQAEMDRAENDIRSISNQMLNARYTYDSSQTDYTQQNAAYETIDKAQKAWEKANKKGDEKGMAAAHKRAEKARANLGFSGGEAGNEYLPFNKPVQQRTEPLSFGDRFMGARDYANTQAKAREDRKYVGDVNTYNQAVQQYENSGYAGHVAGRRNQGQMKSSAMNKTGPSGGTANPTGGSYNAKLDAIQKNISERDRFVYNYLYSTQGKKAADNFLDAAWNVNISQTAANRANEQLSDWAKAHPVAATVTSTMMQPFNTMAGAGQMVNNAVTGQKADPYFSAIGNTTNTSREAVKSTIGSGVGRGAYDVGTNIADMVLDTVLGGTIGGAAGSGASTTAKLAARRGIVGAAFKRVANNKVANKAIDKLLSSSAITTGLMSTQSAYSTYVQSVNSGVATDVALSNAVANGALEFLSEMPAVENLFSLGKLGRMGGAPISNAKDFAKKLGAQMGIEAGGEAFANLTQTAADSVLMGSRSQVAQQAAVYEGQGMSPEEALKQARIDSYYTQTWQAAAMGAIAGGIMSGGAMGVGTVRTGQYIRGNSDFARDLATVYQSELGNGKYKKIADTILNTQEGEAPARVGVIKAANMKGELAKHFADQMNDPSMKEYLYNYVGLDVPNSRAQQMKDIFAEYLGRDTGYASKEFSDAWLRVSRDMEMNLALYRQTHDPQLREALEEYLDNATMLLYSGELNDAAETTSIVRAEVNAELNGINANAGGNAVVSEDIDTVVEQGQVNEEGDPVEEAVLQEETPVAPEDQQAVQQEAETIGDVVEGVADESGVDVQTQAVSSTAFNPEGEKAVVGTTAPTTAPTTGTTAGTTSGTNGTISSGGATVTEVPPQTGSITEGTVSQIGTTEQNAGTQTQFEPTDSYPVGQKNRGNVTYHRSAGNPTGRIEAARNIMRANGLSTDSYDVISENDNGTVTFINAKDFDTATEPVVLNKVIVDLNDGSIRNETSGTEIIPEKSQLVPADYSGFDVDAQRAREDSWRNQSGIRFNATRLNDKAYFEETFGDYLRQQEGANNDAERYEETGTSRDTAEREPVSSTEGEGRTEEVRGEDSGQVVSDLPEESERVPVSGRESTGNGTDSTEQSSGRNESDIVEEDENTLEEAIEEELTEDNVSFEERSEEESEEESEEPANLMDGAIVSSEVTEVYAPSDNTPIRVRYAIVPVESLIASNDPSGQVNPDYPSELQPRDRTRQATQDQIVTTLGNLNPNKLLDNKMNAADGAPIVRSDGVVVSGNMRTMTLTRMYETNQEKSDNYKETILARAADLNIDTSNAPEHPVLVGITEINDIDELVDLSRRLNTQSTAAFSATEQALTDSSKMDASLVDEIVPFEKNLSVSNNQKFIYDFINEIVPESEKGGMINSKGELSKSGRERIEYAIFAYGYEDAELVERLSESLDDNAKNITNSLLYSAGKAAKYRNLVSEGRVADNPLTESILNAVNIYLRAKANGFTVDEYLAQGQIAIGEDGNAIDVQNASVEEWLAGFIADNIRSAKRITAMINYLYDTAMEEEQIAGQESIFSMFADESMSAPEDMTLEDIYTTASDRYFNEEGGQNAKGERYTRSTDTSQESETSESSAGESETEGRGDVADNGVSAEENNDGRNEESEVKDEGNTEESNKESSPSENAAGPNIVRTIDKLPKGVKIKWSEVEKFKEKEYRYSTVQVAPSGNNLYVKLSGTYKGNPVKQVFYEIQNYKNVTANEIFMDLITNTDGLNPYPLGIHFEDAIRKFYKENDLSQGSVVPILRELNSEEQEISEEINDTVSENNITVAEQEESEEVEEPVEERETVEEAEEPIQETTQTTQAEQVESEQSELEEEFDEVLDENGIKFAREVGKSSSKNGKSSSKNNNTESSEEQAEETVQEETESEETPVEESQTEEAEETEETEEPDTYRPPTRGSFANSRAEKDYGITSGIVEKITEADRNAVKNPKDIQNRIKAKFGKVKLFTKRYSMGKGVLGWYDPLHTTIHMQEANKVGVMCHELGHHIAQLYDIHNKPEVMKQLKDMVKNIPDLKDTLKDAGYRVGVMPEEVFADFVWHYLINPDAAYEMGSHIEGDGNFYDTFENMLSGVDKTSLQGIRKMIIAYNNKPIKERIAGTISTREEAEKNAKVTILKVLKGERTAEEFGDRWNEFKRRIITHLIDFTRPATEITKRLRKINGGEISSDLDLQYQIESMTMADSTTAMILSENFITPGKTVLGELGSFFGVINKLQKNVKSAKRSEWKDYKKKWFRDFEVYLRARHGIDWETQGKKTMSSDIAGNLAENSHDANIAAYEKVIAELDEEYGGMMEESSEELYKWWRAFGQIWMVDTGLVDADQMDMLQEMYPHYIPMQRILEDEWGGKNGGMDKTNQVMKRSAKEGSERDTYSPIENMALYINRVVKTHQRNCIARTIHDLWRSADPDIRYTISEYVQQIQTPSNVQSINVEGLKDRLKDRLIKNTKVNLSKKDLERIEKMSNKAAVAELSRLAGVSVVDSTIDDVLKAFYPDASKADEKTIIYREGNNVICYQITDRAFFEMMQASHKDSMSMVMKLVGKGTRMWSGLVTSNNVFFAVRNAVRDWQHAYVMGKDMGFMNWEYFWRYPLAFAEVLFNTYKPGQKNNMMQLYEAANSFESKYISQGGGILERALKEADINYSGRKNPVDGLSALVNFVVNFNAAIEAAPRYAQFKATYNKTEGDAKEKFAKAMRNSREVTVNFHKGGASNTLSTFGSFIPFVNATVAGLKQAQEVLVSKEAWTTKEGLGRIVRMLAIQSVPALLMALAYKDDKEYQKFENYLKEGYWLFKVGDTWIRLPKDREFSAFASTPVTQYFSARFNEDFDKEEAIASVMSYLYENWVPSFSTTFAGLIQARSNRAWYGGDIISSVYEDSMVADHYQYIYDGTTSRLGIAAARAIAKLPGPFQDKLEGLATPKGIDYAIDQMFGIIGDIVLPMTKPTEGIQGTIASFRNQFVADPDKSDRYISEAYDIYDKIQAGQSDGHMSKFDEKWADAFSTTMRKSSTRGDKEPDFKTVGDYMAEMRDVKQDASLSYKERQERITDLYKAIGNICEDMVKRYRAGKGPTKDNYGDINLTDEAKEAGFTDPKQYGKIITELGKKDTYNRKQYYIASSDLSAEQKQYLSQHTMSKNYEDYSEDMEPLVQAGLSYKQAEKYLKGNKETKYYNLLQDNNLSDENKTVIGNYFDSGYSAKSLEEHRQKYQPMIDAGWSAEKTMSEIEKTKKYSTDKANIINALQRYQDDKAIQDSMVGISMGRVKSYNSKEGRYVAYANSGLSPELIDKAYRRHKELESQGYGSRESYIAAAKEYASGKDYNLLFNVLYMK